MVGIVADPNMWEYYSAPGTPNPKWDPTTAPAFSVEGLFAHGNPAPAHPPGRSRALHHRLEYRGDVHHPQAHLVLHPAGVPATAMSKAAILRSTASTPVPYPSG